MPAPATAPAATAAQLTEARGWLTDLALMRTDGAYMDDDDHQALADEHVTALVTRLYDGGWTGFLADTADHDA